MAGRFSPYWISVGFLIATCTGLLLHMGLVVVPAFEDLTRLTLPDARLTGYEPQHVMNVLEALRQSPEAASLFRALHLVPDMIFPAAYTLLSLMLLAKFAPGVTVFHKPLSGYRLWLVFAVPVLYAVCDYAENGMSLALFPPANPDAETVARLSDLLPLATRAKAMFFFITLIFLLRFSLFAERPAPAAGHDDSTTNGPE
jgi:hypothetical protein